MKEIKEFEFRENIYYNIIPKNKIGCELGVARGFNAINLFHCTKPKCLHLVDLWPKKEDGKNIQVSEFEVNDYEDEAKKIFEYEIKNGTVKLHKINTVDFLKSLLDKYLDWVYIDSAHSYNHVKAEINLSLEKVKPGGLIMGHDFHPGDNQRSGVIRAVIETIQNNKVKMIAISSEQYASWVCEVL